MREGEDGELALGHVLSGVGVGGIDGFGVPGADESVARDGEKKLVERVVAQLADEAAVGGAGGEVVVAGVGGGVGEERRNVPEHDAAVLAAAGEDGVGVGEREIGDFAAMTADGAARNGEKGETGQEIARVDVPDFDEMIVRAGEGEAVGFVDSEAVDGRVAMAGKHLQELRRLETKRKKARTLKRLMNTSGEIEPACMSARSRFCRIELSMLCVTTNKKSGKRSRARRGGDSIR